MHALLLTLAVAVSPYDALLSAEWKKAHVRPAPPVDDARFLRRVFLDLAGEAPPIEVVRAFLDDRAPGKRARLVETLLESPRYAEHFTDYWTRVLLGRNPQVGNVDEQAFRDWLRARLADGTHWDVLARELIAANGRNSDGGARNPAQRAKQRKLDAILDPSPTPEPAASAIALNGAVNYVLRYVQQPEDLTGHYARVFLGVQIQCAQCHNHPSEKQWKQEDFRRLAAAFAHTRAQPIDDAKMGIRRVMLIDAQPRKGPKFASARALAQLSPVTLDGTDLAGGTSARAALADWTVARGNRFFARAIVNRYWAYFLGRGFVEPVDDFRTSNPPQAAALLDRLTADFVAANFDLKWLIRAICATRVYQLSAAGRDGRLWADYRLRPLDPEELLSAIAGATGLASTLKRIGGGNLDALPVQLRQLLIFLFDVDGEDAAADAFSGTLPQALFALNGTLVNFGASARPGSTLAEVLALPLSDEQKITALYLRALSRPPAPSETKRWLEYLAAPRTATRHAAPPPPDAPKGKAARASLDPVDRFAARDARFHASAREQAWEDLFWALLNSSEFTFHH